MTALEHPIIQGSKALPGGISSSVLSVFFTDNCYKLLKSLHLIGWEQICQWKSLTKCLMKCPPPPVLPYIATLTKGSKWQIIQIWERDVFRLDSACPHTQPEFWAEAPILLKDIHRPDIITLHWWQCTWQTHFAHLLEMSFSNVASFCKE